METEVERRGKGVQDYGKGWKKGKLKNKRQVEDSKKKQKTEYDNTYTPTPVPFSHCASLCHQQQLTSTHSQTNAER